MDIKLDQSTEEIINQTYSIDSSVLRQIEQRRQAANSAQSSFSEILSSSPKMIEPPVQTDSAVKNIDQNLDYQYKLKVKELDSILDLLAKIDVQIDEIDLVIRNLDNQALSLVNEINAEIDNVKASYEYRVSQGCVSDLVWEYVGRSYGYNFRTGAAVSFSNYRVVKDPAQKSGINYYGIKYYQKPSNRDYGFNALFDFSGTIKVGTNSLAVLTPNVIGGIQIGDQIADSIDNPQAFGLGEFPSVIGYGTTDILGITTSIYGSVSLGSSIISASGVGSTENILIGNYVINENLFSSDTRIVGFGTTVSVIIYNDPNTSTFITTETVVPSIILDKVSIGIATDKSIGFGTYSSYSCLNLSASSNTDLVNHNFTVVRVTEDITSDFDYTKSPLDPVKIGIIDSSQIGVGHISVLINNGESSAPVNWREVLKEPEPAVGNNKAVYYTGLTRWPYTYIGGYANEGEVYKFSSSGIATYISASPTGIATDGPECTSYYANIITAQNNLESVKSRNLPKIQQLVSASNSLRYSRNSQELKAWSYLQAASYVRKELNDITTQLNAIRSFDYDSF